MVVSSGVLWLGCLLGLFLWFFWLVCFLFFFFFFPEKRHQGLSKTESG